MAKRKKPYLEILDKTLVEEILDEGMDVLEKIGVYMENPEGWDLLTSSNCRGNLKTRRITIPRDVVERAVKTAPSRLTIYSRGGEPALDLSGDNIHFDPGSAAIHVLDGKTLEIRRATARDYVDFTRLTDALPFLKAQSTALIPSDVPKPMADSYRLFLSLCHSPKPVVTGIFSKESFSVMKEMLVLVSGGERRLREKPIAIFDACPSPPLKWSTLTCQSVIEAARAGIPSEFISMPLAGGTAPVTLAGSLVQHTAETLSGVVIAQLASPGAPVIYGGSPAVLDMRRGTTPMGAIETMMIDLAYTQIGKRLGFPVQAYMGLSDSKLLDAQAGLETASGALLAALGGIHVISGPGMMDFESCQSLEKLYLDNDICGMAYRLKEGVVKRNTPMALDLFRQMEGKDTFLTLPDTREWYRKEHYFPSEVIDRNTLGAWKKEGRKSAWDRAREGVRSILETHTPESLGQDLERELRSLMLLEARKHGLEKLPL